MTALEDLVIDAARRGEVLDLRTGAPDEALLDPEVIRELLEGRRGVLHYRGIRISGVRLGADLDLSYSRWSGRLELTHCSIDGAVLLGHAQVQGRIVLDGTKVLSVEAPDARIDGSFQMRDGFEAVRGVRAIGLEVTGGLSFRGAHLTAPEDNDNYSALGLYRAQLGDLFLVNTSLVGGLYGVGMTVRRNVRLQGSSVVSRRALGWASEDAGEGAALSAATIGGSIYLWSQRRGPVAIDGELSLRGTNCTALVAAPEILRTTPADVSGFRYVELRGVTGEDMLLALNRGQSTGDDAYVILADLAARRGAVDFRREVLIALERRHAGRLSPRSVAGITKRASGIVVGYGHRPARALLWLLGCLALAAVVLRYRGQFYVQDDLPVGSHGWAESVALAADATLPFDAVRLLGDWHAHPDSSADWLWLSVFTLLRIGAWAFAAIWAASITGIIRRS